MSIAYRLAGVGLAALLATPASAQLLAHKDLSMATALTIATTAIETCKAQGLAACRRRWSAATARSSSSCAATAPGRTPSRTASRRPTPRAPSASRRASSSSASRTTRRSGAVYLTGIVAAQGALPIKIGDEMIGAAGVSGAPGGEKDEACVQGRPRQGRRSAEVTGSSSNRLRAAPAAPAPHAQRAEHDRRQGDQDRHQRDVAEFEHRLQPLDVLAQRAPARRAIGAGSPACRRGTGRSALVCSGDNVRVRVGRLALAVRPRSLACASLSFCCKRLLLGGVAVVGVALDLLDDARTAAPRCRGCAGRQGPRRRPGPRSRWRRNRRCWRSGRRPAGRRNPGFAPRTDRRACRCRRRRRR